MKDLCRRLPSTVSESVVVSAAALIARVALALMFISSGVSKLTALDNTIAYMTSAGLPLPYVGFAVAVVVEIGCGSLLIIGQFTRIAAIVLAAFTIVTAIAFHSALSDQNQLVHSLKNVAIAGGLLHVFAFGAGRISLDARLTDRG